MPAGFSPIVADNGSTDGSGDLARALGARVVEEPRPGFGAACFAGLLAARADVVCFMDCDASFDPAELPSVAGPVADGTADLVLGARRPAPDAAWPVHARAANAVLAFELRRRTGARITDLGPMRAALRGPLLALGLRDRRFGWPLEMVIRAAAAGWRIEETPVRYLPREGRSKVSRVHLRLRRPSRSSRSDGHLDQGLLGVGRDRGSIPGLASPGPHRVPPAAAGLSEAITGPTIRIAPAREKPLRPGARVGRSRPRVGEDRVSGGGTAKCERMLGEHGGEQFERKCGQLMGNAAWVRGRLVGA